MTSLPAVSSDDFIRAVRVLGYEVARMRGSHITLHAVGRRTLVVPRRREIAHGTLRGLIRDAGLTVEEFSALLRG